MLKSFIGFLDRLSRGRVILGTFAACAVVMGYLFTYVVPHLRLHSAHAEAPDTHFGYSPDAAYEMIGSFGDDIRSFYVVNAFTADVIGPFFMNLTLALVGLWLMRQAFGPESRFRLHAVLWPLLVFLFDITENALMSIIVSRYPARLDGLVRVCSVVTQGKWVSFMVCLLVLVGSAMAAAAQALRRRPAQGGS